MRKKHEIRKYGHAEGFWRSLLPLYRNRLAHLPAILLLLCFFFFICSSHFILKFSAFHVFVKTFVPDHIIQLLFYSLNSYRLIQQVSSFLVRRLPCQIHTSSSVHLLCAPVHHAKFPCFALHLLLYHVLRICKDVFDIFRNEIGTLDFTLKCLFY